MLLKHMINIKRKVSGIIDSKLNCRRYGESWPDSYKIINVKPEEVNYMLVPGFRRSLYHKTTHIVGSSWDINRSDNTLMYVARMEDNNFENQKLIKYENYGFYNSLKAHFDDGISWENTDFYQWAINNAESSSVYYNKNSIKERLNKLDSLYNHIAENGYRSQQELSNDDSDPFNSDTSPCPEHNEVWVNIGRDGEIIFETGRHRFSIAKILNIEKIPVRVFIRHKKWQNVRKNVCFEDSSDYFYRMSSINKDHPDLRDVI